MFGIALLSFNFANEYAAMDGEIPFMELSSVQSMIKRTGQNPEYNAARSEFVAWGAFLPEQFRRIGRMALPYAITVHTDGLHHAHPTGPISLPYAAIGIAAAGASLLATAIPAPPPDATGNISIKRAMLGHRNALQHRPARLGKHILCRHPISIVHPDSAKVAATDPPSGNNCVNDRPANFRAFRLPHSPNGSPSPGAFTGYQHGGNVRFPENSGDNAGGGGGGKRVYIQMYELDPYSQDVYFIIDYYLAGNIIQPGQKPISDCGPQCGQYYDFIISGNRNLYPETHLLTPSNQEAFLFNTAAINTNALTAKYRAVYDTVVSGAYGAPTVRAEYDLFISNGNAIYYKSRCNASDTTHKFFLHTTPDDRNHLPDERKEYGFDNLDFSFIWRGAKFDGNCIAIAPLPDYPIASIRTGQIPIRHRARNLERSHFAKEPPEYNAPPPPNRRRIRQSDGRGVFDVYLTETTLIYYKNPLQRR